MRGSSAFLIKFCYEMMSNYSHNYWIDWNSAVLCFKWLFHIGVWTFAWSLRNLVPHIHMYYKFYCWQKKIDYQQKTKHVTTPILKLTNDYKPETFFGGPNLFFPFLLTSEIRDTMYMYTCSMYMCIYAVIGTRPNFPHTKYGGYL